jgi:hypothetical protein
MDRVLQPLQERFKLVDSLLQGFDAPLVRRNMGLGTQIRCPPSSTQLSDTPKDRDATNRAPAWIAGTRHSRNLPLPPSQEPREGRRKQDPTSGTDRTGLVTKTTRPPTSPASLWRKVIILATAPSCGPRPPMHRLNVAQRTASGTRRRRSRGGARVLPETAHDEGREEQEPRI